MNSLFNSGPEPSADEPLRPVTASSEPAGADDDSEPNLFASTSRRAASPSFGSGAAAGSPADKEITLSTMTVLGIFFLLAVMCAGFFAFGYSTGSKHGGKPGTGASITDAGLPACKPAPGSLIGAAAPAGTVAPMNVPYTQPSPSAARPVSASVAPAPMAEAVTVPVAPEPTVVVPERAAARTAPVAVPVPAPVAAPAAQQPTMVQVAALSHQADAEMVASALKGRGYSVSIHSSASDPLMHVQLGPFATRKDAEVMRQKLLSDGFNAILK